jgi:MFS family permease
MALFIIIFSVSLGFSIVNPFLPIYMTHIGAGGISIAFIFSGYSFSKILFTPFLGRLSDCKGRINLIILGLLIYSFVSLCYLCMPNNVTLLIILRLTQGIGAALVRPIALALVGERAPQNREGTVMGAFDVSFYAALSMGPIVGGFIKDLFGFPGIFGLLFALCTFSLLIAFFGISGADEPIKASKKNTVDYRMIIESRTILSLFFFIFTRSFGISVFAVFLPIIMNSDLHFSSLQIGVIMASGSTLTALLLRPIGKMSDKLNRRALITIGGGAAALFTFLLPFAVGFWHLLVLSSCIGSFSALSLPSSSALLIAEGNRYGIGMTMGLFNSIMGIGFVAAPLVGGFLIGMGGQGIVFHAAGLIGFLGVCFFCLLNRASGPKTILIRN